MPIDLTTPAADPGVRAIIEATTDPAERRRVATDPAVVRIVERAAALSIDERRRISRAHDQHVATYRSAMMLTRRKVRHAGGPDHLTTRALTERIHEILDCPASGPCAEYHTCGTAAFTCAVTDAIFAHLARGYLTADEVRLFDGPWSDQLVSIEQDTTAAIIDVDAVELPGADLYEVADRIEAAMRRAGRRGVTPSAAGRAARVDTTTAGQVLRWMVARQYAHTDDRGAWSRYYAGRPH